ncbi:TetR/AcrR family transcriptional regulator [Planktotalea sp.]|uniref:TetR/AcrR family transcriptional regulator n=1 Tax=Planktotalea sp. TaxID=2029877 RepID=UPI003296C6D5
MSKPLQKRTLATRAKLIASAEKIISAKGYAAMRVEDVVAQAGVAKGTFFAHFPDKDALMDLIVGAEMDKQLDQVAAKAPPQTVDELIEHIMPFLNFVSHDRYTFDLIIRHSGAGAKEEFGPIALTFERQIKILTTWLATGPFRKDVDPQVLAEGIQAFYVQCMAMHFCSINKEPPMQIRLTTYLKAWLLA